MNILVVGAGQVGYFLCERLSMEGHQVTLIDRDQEHLNAAQDRLNVLGILGNGASAKNRKIFMPEPPSKPLKTSIAGLKSEPT